MAHRWPKWLPGESAALFTIHTETSEEIALIDMETGAVRVLIADGTTPTYAPSGHIVYAAADSSLRAVRFDLGSLEVTSSPVPVLEGLSISRLTRGAHYALAGDGTLIYASGSQNFDTGLQPLAPVLVDHEGQLTETGIPPCFCEHARFSPDGTRLAMSLASAESGSGDIWVWSFAQGVQTRLSFERGEVGRPVWSPDSTRIAYTLAGDGIYIRQADGTGEAQRILDLRSIGFGAPTHWTQDDQIVYMHAGTGSSSDISLLSLADTANPTPLFTSSFAEDRGQVSPDGRWLAYNSTESGRREVYVRPFPDVGTGKWQISTSGGGDPRWSPDGNTLYYQGDTALMAASIRTEPGFMSETPIALFDTSQFGGTGADFEFDVAPDGESFIFGRSTLVAEGQDRDTERGRIVVVQNWLEELERLVPAE